jgi:hypothetical protein
MVGNPIMVTHLGMPKNSGGFEGWTYPQMISDRGVHCPKPPDFFGVPKWDTLIGIATHHNEYTTADISTWGETCLCRLQGFKAGLEIWALMWLK